MDNSLASRIEGAFLGLALGDALGAPYEGGPLERALWRLLGRTRTGARRWTDDTQMSLDLAEHLLEHGTLKPDQLAQRFAASYRWDRGYGPGAARLLKRIARGTPWQQAVHSVYPEGSWGNGAAMRAPVVGLFCASCPAQLPAMSEAAARITHGHPLAIEGALLIARATALTLQQMPPDKIIATLQLECQQAAYGEQLAQAATWLTGQQPPAPNLLARTLGNGIAARDSCVTALYLGLGFRSKPLLELLHYIVKLGGDTDTIGAMAAALWGAANGAQALPGASLAQLEQLPRLQAVAAALADIALNPDDATEHPGLNCPPQQPN